MERHLAIRCRIDDRTGRLEFLGVATTDASGERLDVRSVTPELAAIAERLVAAAEAHP